MTIEQVLSALRESLNLSDEQIKNSDIESNLKALKNSSLSQGRAEVQSKFEKKEASLITSLKESLKLDGEYSVEALVSKIDDLPKKIDSLNQQIETISDKSQGLSEAEKKAYEDKAAELIKERDQAVQVKNDYFVTNELSKGLNGSLIGAHDVFKANHSITIEDGKVVIKKADGSVYIKDDSSPMNTEEIFSSFKTTHSHLFEGDLGAQGVGSKGNSSQSGGIKDYSNMSDSDFKAEMENVKKGN